MALLEREECMWEVQDYYQKQTYRNRTYICTDQGKHMLSIPIQHVGGKQGKQFYRDVKIDNQYPWQRLHWRTLQTAYRSSPFFEYYEEDLLPIFEERHTYLLEFNFRCIAAVCSVLGLSLPEGRTTVYEPDPQGKRDMRHLVNAKSHLSFNPSPYTQVFTERHGFIGNLSVLDLLFNEGTHSVSYLRELLLPFADD
jgi:hypothetical protein